MRNINLAIVFMLSLFTFAATAQNEYEILAPSDITITIGGVTKKKGQTFKDNEEIQWGGQRQAMYARRVSDQSLFLFSKEAFESKKVKTVKNYLVKGQFSTMDNGSTGIFKAAQNRLNFNGEKRIALIIANSNYKNASDFLKNPVNDAVRISETLNRIGFDTRTYYDVRSDQQKGILDGFVREAAGYNVALFYFAGHGDVYREHAFYYPVDAAVTPASHEEYCMVGADIVEKLSSSTRKVTMLFFDACRTRSTRGQPAISLEATDNMCIMNSTSYGDVAIDGSATLDNSPFASAFCNNIGTQGMSVNDVLSTICQEVSENSSKYQNPKFSALDKVYYLVPGVRNEHAPMKEGVSPESDMAMRNKTDRPRTFVVKGVQFTMIPVDGGTFQMGATEEQGSEAASNEKPVHSVTLSSYMIGETEVTQALWQAVMGSNPSNWKGDNLPVVKVSWNDCQTFIKKLNELTGEHFRLPTEAEWEFAARGGSRSSHTKYSGSNSIGEVAWYTDNSSSKTHEVKGKRPNELGLYDMSGNVWEWCQDLYGSYSSSAQTNPVGPASGSDRVYRGGCWGNYARSCRVSERVDYSPDYGNMSLGLRLAL